MNQTGKNFQPFLLLIFLFFCCCSLFLLGVAAASTKSISSSILFGTFGRSRYTFDIFSDAVHSVTLPSAVSIDNQTDLQLTDGVSVNYNGFFANSTIAGDPVSLLYVSERDGTPDIYLDLLRSSPNTRTRREALQLSTRHKFPLLPPPTAAVSMKDRPSLSDDHLVYVSTHIPSHYPRQSSAAVYSTHLPTSHTRRLTPSGVSDVSPSVSPSGLWPAVASSDRRRLSIGDVQELNTVIYLFRTRDGSDRVKLIDRGGWPCWADDSILYFHRLAPDGWWSVYRATVDTAVAVPSVVSIDRITAPGFHAMTPAATAVAPWLLAVATRRHNSRFRHTELIDLRSGGGSSAYIEVTRQIAPNSDHYNPFFSPDASRIGYHRCRGGHGDAPLLLESVRSPSPETLSMFRIDAAFPSVSPDGRRIAFTRKPDLYIMDADGSGEPQKVFTSISSAFGMNWDWKRQGVIYTSSGPEFAAEKNSVDIISIILHEEKESSRPTSITVKKLTVNGKNNAFPSASPDGKWVVFRSGLSGHENLYIMDAVEGESVGSRRLTEGPWTDTMCNWSPDGEWIAFSSDRHNPGGGSFAAYIVHPNGTGLRRVVHSGDGGRTMHPWFSPDSKSLVFTTDYGGVTAEAISSPLSYQSDGDIFTVKIDGSDLRRLTHNSYEDGTPTWTSHYLKPADVVEPFHGNDLCNFVDGHWLNSKAQFNNVSPRTSC